MKKLKDLCADGCPRGCEHDRQLKKFPHPDGESEQYDAPDESHSEEWNVAIMARAAIAKAEGWR